MVTNVETNGLFDGTFTKIMKQVYMIASTRALREELDLPIELYPYMEGLYKAFDSSFKIRDTKVSFEEYELDAHDTRCICAFSGGKDSLANILMLKEQGYDPVAFFVKGINYQYGHEYQIAKTLAERMKIPFVERKVTIHGKNEFPENPVKDQFILAMMLDYGLKQGIVNYSFGTYIDSPISKINREYMLSDSSEMFDRFQSFVNYIYPEVDFPFFLLEAVESLRVIVDYDVSLLDYTCSCMSPVRFKKGYIENARKKYGVDLIPNRCPSCYKCCIEAIQLNAFGVTHYPDAYIEHCKDIMINWYRKLGKQTEEEIARYKSDDFEWVPSIWLEGRV